MASAINNNEDYLDKVLGGVTTEETSERKKSDGENLL